MPNISRIKYIERKVPKFDYPIKLEVGCGDEKHRHPDRKQGWIGVDIVDYGQEVVWDIEEGLPFADRSVASIYTSHTMEHIGDIIGVMNEFWRVMQDDGELYIVAPYFENEKALLPSHINLFSKWYFNFFEYGSVERDYGTKPWTVIETIVNGRKDLHVRLKPDRTPHQEGGWKK